MTNQPLCDQCNQRPASPDSCRTSRGGQSCKDLFQKLGQDKGPSVTRAVLAAFLLPIVIFIAALAASQHFLARLAEDGESRRVAAALSSGLQTIVSLLIAVFAVILCVLITRAVNMYVAKRKQ